MSSRKFVEQGHAQNSSSHLFSNILDNDSGSLSNINRLTLDPDNTEDLLQQEVINERALSLLQRTRERRNLLHRFEDKRRYYNQGQDDGDLESVASSHYRSNDVGGNFQFFDQEEDEDEEGNAIDDDYGTLDQSNIIDRHQERRKGNKHSRQERHHQRELKQRVEKIRTQRQVGNTKKFTPSSLALYEIRKYQRSSELLISKIPFTKLVKEVTDEFTVEDQQLHWQSMAIVALQEASEASLFSGFIGACQFISHTCQEDHINEEGYTVGQKN